VVVAQTAEEADAAVRAGKVVAAADYRVVTQMKTVQVMLKPPACRKLARAPRSNRRAAGSTFR
jgi:hypothetical protein